MPGFAYLGGLDPRLHTSRRESLRLKTRASNISIGGMQTAVGSVEAPSGGHLIGRTPVRSFVPDRESSRFCSAPATGSVLRRSVRAPLHVLDMAIMANGLEVLTPGVYTTIQDEGQFGFEDYGVPPSGAMDEMSFSIANALAGNPVSTRVRWNSP